MKVNITLNSDDSVYRNQAGRVVIEKNGTYFGLNDDEMKQLKEIIEGVLGEFNERRKN